MEDNELIKKSEKTVKIFTWIILILATLTLLSSINSLAGSNLIDSFFKHSKFFSNKVDIKINMMPYKVLSSVKFLISGFIVISSLYVLQYKENWRTFLIYGLVSAIIYLMISPLVNYFNFPIVHFSKKLNIPIRFEGMAKTAILVASYLWSILWSSFFAVAIVKYNKSEVKLLFK